MRFSLLQFSFKFIGSTSFLRIQILSELSRMTIEIYIIILEISHIYIYVLKLKKKYYLEIVEKKNIKHSSKSA